MVAICSYALVSASGGVSRDTTYVREIFVSSIIYLKAVQEGHGKIPKIKCENLWLSA
jgi:hypothetical protein